MSYNPALFAMVVVIWTVYLSPCCPKATLGKG